MMHIVSPLSQCASLEKRDRFLDYIRSIAPVTHNTEPNCHGYAWFKSADDNDVVPSHWLRGFEIYGSKDASHVEHRASDEYKTFRKAVGEEGLLARPSDLQFWHPTGLGFLTKGTAASFSAETDDSTPQYIITDEFKTTQTQREQVLKTLASIAAAAEKTEGVLSFWVLSRVGADGVVVPEVDGDSIYVFMRFVDRTASQSFCGEQTAAEWKQLEPNCAERRRTTWVESGIGFLGR
ncbi:hypothetical protein LIA77_11120 [Sarocladium implicatum]|nr:hypothetical protein LIA77_11120 [Sarocladium implicatum]